MARTAAEKHRAEVVLPKGLVERIDSLAGRRGRTKFIERAVRAELRRRAFEEWIAFGRKLKGLTLEDTYYTSKRQLEERGR